MESLAVLEVGEIGSSSISSSFQHHRASSFQTTTKSSPTSDGRLFKAHDQKFELAWAAKPAIEKLRSLKRLRTSLFDRDNSYGTNENNGKAISVVDVKELGAAERHLFIDNLRRHLLM